MRDTGSSEQERERAVELAQADLLKKMEGGADTHAEAVERARRLADQDKGRQELWSEQEKLIEWTRAHYIGESVLEGMEAVVRDLPPEAQAKFYEQAPVGVLVAPAGERYEDTSLGSRKFLQRSVTLDALQGVPSFDDAHYAALVKLLLRTRLLRTMAREAWPTAGQPNEAFKRDVEDYLMAAMPITDPVVGRSGSLESRQEVAVIYAAETAGRNMFPDDTLACLRLAFQADPTLFTDIVVLSMLRERIGGLEQDRVIGGHADRASFLEREAGRRAEDGIPYRDDGGVDAHPRLAGARTPQS